MIISVTSEIRLENRSGEIYEIVYYAETFCGEYNHISECNRIKNIARTEQIYRRNMRMSLAILITKRFVSDS